MVRASRKLLDCPHCKQQMHLSAIESARHLEICSAKVKATTERKVDSEESNSKQRRYFCAQCESELELSAIDILRHRQMHASSG